MDVLLLRELAEVLARSGSVALRFDFGGAGSSGGVFSGGEEEPADVAAGLAYLESLDSVNTGATCVAGWSFGAWMALSAVADGLAAHRVVAVAPPLAVYGWHGCAGMLASTDTERHYLVGDADRFCPIETLRSFAGEISEADLERITVLPNADHFLAGREREVSLLVAGIVSKAGV